MNDEVTVQARPRSGGVALSNLLADNKTLDQMFDLYTHHYLGAAKGLLSAIGNNLHNEMSFKSRRELKRCIATIAVEAPTVIEEEARCVLNAYHMLDNEKNGVVWVGAFGIRRMKREAARLGRRKGAKGRGNIQFRQRPYVKFLERMRQRRTIPEEYENHIHRLVDHLEKEKTVNSKDQFNVKTLTGMPELIGEERKSPVVALAKMASELFRGDDSGKASWKQSYQKITELEQQMKLMNRVEKSNRAFDQVLSERASHTFAGHEMALGENEDHPLRMIQDVNSVIDQLGASDDESIDFLSPKFMRLLPHEEDKEKKSFLSPSLLSFYKDDNVNNIASLPDIMHGTGWKEEDSEAVIDMIMEVSGARQQVDETLKGIEGLVEWQEVARAVVEADKKMNATWERLFASFSPRQKDELDTIGYTFSDPYQIEDMYFSDDAFYKGMWQNDVTVDEYKRYDDADRSNHLRDVVRVMAGEEQRSLREEEENELEASMRTWPRRMKQRILQPYGFTASILQPSVFGYLILSPFIFSASVLSPQVLSAHILSPAVGFPIILGPRLLSPRILSPRIMAPMILSPVALSPSILRPLVLSPNILTPGLMSPAILSPSALGGKILSPSALNPSILSPGVLNADVLSPSILSKLRRRKRSLANFKLMAVRASRRNGGGII
uniref:Uncharacterized protein n=1 Tax=Plectus sambesii TaxID=2011161 RepID=A0A914W214_9BILA